MASEVQPPAGTSGHGEPQGTVARGAYFGGLLLGTVVAFGGFILITLLRLPTLLSIPLELAAVYGALQATTGVWKRSAAEGLALAERERLEKSDQRPEGGQG